MPRIEDTKAHLQGGGANNGCGKLRALKQREEWQSYLAIIVEIWVEAYASMTGGLEVD